MWKTCGTQVLGNILDELRSDYLVTLAFSFQCTNHVESTLQHSVELCCSSFNSQRFLSFLERRKFLQDVLKYPLPAHIIDFKQNIFIEFGSCTYR